MSIEDNLPLVSVAIITYNQKEYLKECIESVLEQDYPNIEIVVADDASKDGTQEMLKEYDNKYPGKFKLILHKINQGITGNSQSALDSCSGKYITLIGGDDLLGEKNRITEQVQYLEVNNNVSLCGTYTKIIDNKGKLKRIQKDKYNKLNYNVCDLIKSGNSLLPVVSYIFRKKDIAHFDFRLPKASDSLFFYNIANKGAIYIIPQALSTYREHQSHAQSLGYLDDSLVSLALSEYFFPKCLNSIRIARANLYFNLGRKNRIINRKLSKIYYWTSLKINFKIKTVLALVLVILGSKK